MDESRRRRPGLVWTFLLASACGQTSAPDAFPCGRDGACPTGYVCVRTAPDAMGLCRATSCASDADCREPEKPWCNPVLRRCQPSPADDDAGAPDAGPGDAGDLDAGGSDAGSDGGATDAGPADAGNLDAGAPDTGPVPCDVSGCLPGTYCDPSASAQCLPCDVDTKCGPACDDCGSAALCCRGSCEPVATPRLAAVTPVVIPAGSIDQQLDLVGTDLSACAKVLFSGTPLEVTPGGPGRLLAVVPASLLAAAGTFPVQVVNPGGLESNPNSTALFPQSLEFSGRVAYSIASLGPGTLFVGDRGSPPGLRSIDLATWAMNPGTRDSSLVPYLLEVAGAKLFGLTRTDVLLVAPADPTLASSSTLTIGGQGWGFDFDATVGLVGLTGGYQTFDTATEVTQPVQRVNGASGDQLWGVGLDAGRGLFLLAGDANAYLLDAGQSAPRAVIPLPQGTNRGARIDRSRGLGVVTHTGGVTLLDLTSPTPAPVSVALASAYGPPALNSRANTALVAPVSGDAGPTGTFSVILVDLATKQVAAYLGAGSPACASQPRVALDTATNRGFVTVPCLNAVEAYNLNFVVVK